MLCHFAFISSPVSVRLNSLQPCAASAENGSRGRLRCADGPEGSRGKKSGRLGSMDVILMGAIVAAGTITGSIPCMKDGTLGWSADGISLSSWPTPISTSISKSNSSSRSSNSKNPSARSIIRLSVLFIVQKNKTYPALLVEQIVLSKFLFAF